MSLCKKNNTINANVVSSPAYQGISASIKEAIGMNKNGRVKSYGGQTVDMTGNWNWKGDVGGRISPYDNIFKATAKRLNLDWRLCAALCYCESGFRATIENSIGATGLWQIIKRFWHSYAPPGCKDVSYLKDPAASTLGFEKIMRMHLNNNSKAETRNDQIALAIQCYHDGSLGGASPRWYDRKRGKYGNTNESYQYVPKIIRKYKEYCARK